MYVAPTYRERRCQVDGIPGIAELQLGMPHAQFCQVLVPVVSANCQRVTQH